MLKVLCCADSGIKLSKLLGSQDQSRSGKHAVCVSELRGYPGLLDVGIDSGPEPVAGLLRHTEISS